MRVRLRRRAITIVLFAGLLISTAGFETASAAGSKHGARSAGASRTSSVRPATSSVSSIPADFTPYFNPAVKGQNVHELVQCGSTMYAVGSFSSFEQGGTTYARHNAISFSATTGAVTAWNPKVNGHVDAIALTPHCTTAVLGGTFTRVGRTTVSDIAAVNTTSGSIKTSFGSQANHAVDTLQYTHGLFVAGGQFTSINGVQRSRMASLDPTTGAPTAYVNLAFSGTYPQSSPTKIYRSELSHDGTRLLISGVFTTIAGAARQQVAVLDLPDDNVNGRVSLDGWNAPELNSACMPDESFYAKGVNWSPDDSTIYVATTGFHPDGGSTKGPRTGLCDAAAAFSSTPTSNSSEWINYTGCDSLYSVVADGYAVYVGGHQRWLNNKFGCNAAGQGAVPRSGIAAIDPATGLANSWNPGRSRGHGAEDVIITSAGLWIADDNTNGVQMCGGLTDHGGICFFPY